MCVLGRTPVLSQTCSLKLSYMKIPMAQLGTEPIPIILTQKIAPCLGATEWRDCWNRRVSHVRIRYG